MDLPSLSVTDYVVFSAVLFVSVLIGVYNAFQGNSSAEDYLLGSRSFGWLPVAISLMTTIVSAITILGYSGEAYAHGIQLLALNLGTTLASPWVYVTSVSVFYPLKITSVTEYVLMRFNSIRLRQFVVFLVVLKNVLYLGVCLYAPTIAITSVTSLGTHSCIFILGIICTLYSTIGGMRAVIWTDVFQMIIMSIGIFVVAVIAVADVGGLTNVWNLASEGGRTNMFDTNLDIFKRHTFIYTVLFGVGLGSCGFGIDQMCVQRLISVKSKKDIPKILLLNSVGLAVMTGIIVLSGLASYAFYKGCDPMALGLITKKEEIVPYFVMDRTSYLYGMPGLFIATLFCGTLSSLSSAINGVVAVIWTDIVKDLQVMKHRSDFVISIVNKLLSLVTGGILIGTAIMCSYVSGVIQFCLTIIGVVLGPLYGMFLLGMLYPRCKSKGAWAGLLVSWAFITWVGIGAYIYMPPPSQLPYSTELCNQTYVEHMTINLSNKTLMTSVNHPDPSFLNLYRISYLLYPIISSVMCFVVGAAVTYFTESSEEMLDVSPTLIAPFIRKIYWRKNGNQWHLRSQIGSNECGLEDLKG